MSDGERAIDPLGLRLRHQAPLAATAVAVGVLVGVLGLRTDANEGLLTATSILTGLTFSLALQLWERSLDARSSPDSVPADRLRAYEDMQTRLLWTVIGGVLSTGWIAGVLVAVGDAASAPWATGTTAALVTYQLLNVVRALVSLHRRGGRRLRR